MEWTQYRRKGVSEMRPYRPGEDLTHISISEADQPPVPGGMIARNPQNHADQWYVDLQYFKDNFEAGPNIEKLPYAATHSSRQS